MDLKINGRAIICGPMRNGVQYLTGVRRNMETFGSLFDDYRIIIVESDSDDGTPNHLQAWARENDHMEYMSLGPLRNTMPLRTLRLAHARNTILDIIWEKYGDYDYMVMMDPDDVCFYPIEGFHTCWETEVGDDWAAMTANQRDEYYDIWALRGNGCNYDCWVKGQLEGLSTS
jgi:glycosyltransferase involved in cell wall biosynthesis